MHENTYHNVIKHIFLMHMQQLIKQSVAV